jgi:hypothetical protein
MRGGGKLSSMFYSRVSLDGRRGRIIHTYLVSNRTKEGMRTKSTWAATVGH